MILGYICQPQFRIAQNKGDDYHILIKILEKLGCGNIVKPSIDRDEYYISVDSIKDLIDIIIPFFKRYPIYGAKLLNFNDFCMGIDIMKNNGHLNMDGLKELKVLANSMNSFRKLV